MAAAQQNHHALVWAGGGAVALFAGYEFVFKPWLAAKTAAAAPLSPLSSFMPTPTSMVSSPTMVGQTGGPLQGSIVDPRVTPGGDVGQLMWRKNYTQQQATDRLNKVKAAVSQSRAAIQQLQAGGGQNPAAAGINAAQQQLAAETAALAQAQVAYNQLKAAGDAAGAATYQAAIVGHQNDINDLNARIAAAQQPVDNTAAIAAYQGTLAALLAEYTALTGMNLG